MAGDAKTDVYDPWEQICPKCRGTALGVTWVSGYGPSWDVEALKVWCRACGYTIGLRYPSDHERAGEAVDV